MVLGKLLVPGRPTFWIVGPGLTALAVPAGLYICSLVVYHLSSFSLPLNGSGGGGGGWSAGAMVLGKLPVPGRPTILMTVW